MAEIIQRLENTVATADGADYRPRVCGRPTGLGTWEGWIEFVGQDGGTVRTGRETTQPDRRGLEYWSTGLSAVYLEGALERALAPERSRPAAPEEEPAYAGPRDEPGIEDEPTLSLRRS